nr:hypothetical protein CFP56_37101 [Quercus suber]
MRHRLGGRQQWMSQKDRAADRESVVRSRTRRMERFGNRASRSQMQTTKDKTRDAAAMDEYGSADTSVLHITFLGQQTMGFPRNSSARDGDRSGGQASTVCYRVGADANRKMGKSLWSTPARDFQKRVAVRGSTVESVLRWESTVERPRSRIGDRDIENQ